MSEIALINIVNKFNSKTIVIYFTFLVLQGGNIFTSFCNPPRQIDMIIENPKEKSSNWFHKINSIVKMKVVMLKFLLMSY